MFMRSTTGPVRKFQNDNGSGLPTPALDSTVPGEYRQFQRECGKMCGVSCDQNAVWCSMSFNTWLIPCTWWAAVNGKPYIATIVVQRISSTSHAACSANSPAMNVYSTNLASWASPGGTPLCTYQVVLRKLLVFPRDYIMHAVAIQGVLAHHMFMKLWPTQCTCVYIHKRYFKRFS